MIPRNVGLVGRQITPESYLRYVTSYSTKEVLIRCRCVKSAFACHKLALQIYAFVDQFALGYRTYDLVTDHSYDSPSVAKKDPSYGGGLCGGGKYSFQIRAMCFSSTMQKKTLGESGCS